MTLNMRCSAKTSNKMVLWSINFLKTGRIIKYWVNKQIKFKFRPALLIHNKFMIVIKADSIIKYNNRAWILHSLMLKFNNSQISINYKAVLLNNIFNNINPNFQINANPTQKLLLISKCNKCAIILKDLHWWSYPTF